MGGRSASLLTKKQRSRIRDDFEGLGEEKVRRDQQRVRERLRAGLLDFEDLADYPDRQLELAVDDLSDEQLRRALADARLVTERVRLLEGYDEDDITVRARERAEQLAEETDDAATLDELDPRTTGEIRRETERAVRERLSANPWDERADGLLKLAAGAALPAFGLLLVNGTTAGNVFNNNAVAAVVLFLSLLTLTVSLAGVFLVKGAQALKHDVIPAVRTLRRDPGAALRGALGWASRPGQTVRRVWDEL